MVGSIQELVHKGLLESIFALQNFTRAAHPAERGLFGRRALVQLRRQKDEGLMKTKRHLGRIDLVRGLQLGVPLQGSARARELRQNFGGSALPGFGSWGPTLRCCDGGIEAGQLSGLAILQNLHRHSASTQGC